MAKADFAVHHRIEIIRNRPLVGIDIVPQHASGFIQQRQARSWGQFVQALENSAIHPVQIQCSKCHGNNLAAIVGYGQREIQHRFAINMLTMIVAHGHFFALKRC